MAVALADPPLLAQLTRANLIQMENGRVHLLETLRSFAREQLSASDQLLICQQEHARYFAVFAQQVFTGLLGGEQATWMQRALADHDNCLAALRWALAQGDGETAVAIAGGLWWFWNRRGLFALAREMLTDALQLPSPNLAIRAVALNGLASICLAEEDYAANFAYHEEGLALRRQLNDTKGIATVRHNMGLSAFMMGDYAQAAAWLAESVAIYPEENAINAWAHLGLIAQEMQDLPLAQSWLEQAYEKAMLASEGWTQAFVMNFLADVLRERGDFDKATLLAQNSLRLFTELDDSYYLPDAQMTLAQIMLDQGEYDTAVALSALVRDQYEARDDSAAVAAILLMQSELSWKMGLKEEAAALLARSRTLRQSVTRAISPREQAHYDAVAALTAS